MASMTRADMADNTGAQTKTFVRTDADATAPDAVEPKTRTVDHFEEEQKAAKIAEQQKRDFNASSAELETHESGETMQGGEYANPGKTLPETLGRTVEGVEGEVPMDKESRIETPNKDN